MSRRRTFFWLALSSVAAGTSGCTGCHNNVNPEPMVWSRAAEVAALEALEKANAAAAALQDYTCRFYRHERKGGQLGTKQIMEVKFRARPFSLYMHWINQAQWGAELLYVAGKNDDIVFARLGGAIGWLLPTMQLPVNDPLFEQHSRHKITEFNEGPARLLEGARQARGLGELKARLLGTGDVYGEPARGFEVLLPDEPGYYARRIRIWFHPDTGMMARLEAFNSKDELLEDYAYTNLKINVGLTDADFDPKNPAYRF